MLGDLIAILTFMLYSTLGSVTRTLFGIYKVYTTIPDFNLDMKRVVVEVLASIFFGTFGVILLSGIGSFNYELKIAALIAGFIGADIINLVTKKIGLTKGLEIRLTEEQIALAEFNPRQIRALKYLETHKRITNKIYQTLNQTTPITAKKDLAQLVRKGKLRKCGKGKATYYKLT